MSTIVGLISDTHGLLRPAATRFLRGCKHIIHAGDIGSQDVLDALERIAPTTAVRGNVDFMEWSSMLPERIAVTVAGKRIFITHDLALISNDWEATDFDVVVSGHTHLPEVRREYGILFINPGSAGPPRPGKPVSIGRLIITGNEIAHELVVLPERGQGRSPAAQ